MVMAHAKLTVLGFTHPGLEELAIDELKVLCRPIRAGSDEPGVVRATVIKPEQVIQLCYGTRIFERVVLELARVPFQEIPVTKDAEQFLSHLVKKANISKWLSGRTFRVSYIKSFAQHDVDDSLDVVPSQEMVGLVGAAILAACPEAKVKLENSEVIVQLIYLKKALVLSLDLCGFDLSKREYRIFDHSRTVRGTIAAAAFTLTQWKKGKILVDPLGKAGILLIEAALVASKKPVHYFQKERLLIARLHKPFTGQMLQRVMKAVDRKVGKIDRTLYYQDKAQRFVAAAKKNAKIAGVDKFIKFSRTEVSWLDLRFEENTVAVILTQVPTPGKSDSRKEIEEMLAELFYQAAYVLKKNGVVVLICPDNTIAKKGAEKHGFTLEHELNIYQGMLPLVLQRWVSVKSKRKSRPPKTPRRSPSPQAK